MLLRFGLADLGPYPFHLGRTVPGQLGGLVDAVAGLAQRDNLGAALRISTAALVPPGLAGLLNALALAFAPVLVVVAGHLQGQAKKHDLHGFQHDLGDALGLGRQVG